MSEHWQTLSLAAGGRSLIEASAGTGKTWTIAVLYLRLILEQGLSPRQIVVTTFTDAAAQELRERLRRRLQWAQARAVDGQFSRASQDSRGSEDSDAEWLQARWAEPAQRGRDLDALQLGLSGLEQAPISTLHGLCRRILQDQPFACGVDFDGGELVNGAGLLQELQTDLWRCLQQGPEDEPLRLAMQAAGIELDEKTLRHWLKLGLQPGLEIHAPALTPLALNPALADELDAVAALPATFNKTAVLPRALQALAQALRGGEPPGADYIARLQAAQQQTGVLKAAQGSPRIVAALAQAADVGAVLAERAEQLPLQLLQQLVQAARERLQSLLAQRRLQSFDSLLETVDAALERELSQPGRPLADALFAAWPVALVDEFQDTDSLQYAILDRIYRNADTQPRGRLAMIGDPKQAIYRFRGSDIHAYRRAAAEIDDFLRLRVNQRSAAALVAGCNELFERAGSALGSGDDCDTHYEPVQAAGRADSKPYQVDGETPQRPLVVHYLDDAPLAQPQRRALALQACADQILLLLNDPGQQIDGRSLSPADIAVLLPTARDILELRRQLQQRGVACVSASRDSVFAQDCARDLQVLLYGVLHPLAPGALRAAAATRLWGTPLSELRRWAQQPEALQRVALEFRALGEAWQSQGVLRLVDLLLERLAPQVLGSSEGERLLTDLRHLGELLQAQAEHLGGPLELLAWLDAQRQSEDGADQEALDERQLRIESQQPRLRLMTLHASKGLEFPIVMLPLMWAHGGRTESEPYRVSTRFAARPRLAFDAQAKQQQLQELQDERFRLFYVALTRAVHACHVFALAPDRQKDARSTRITACDGLEASALDLLLQRLQAAPDFSPAELARIDWIKGWPEPSFTRLSQPEAAEAVRAARPLWPRPAGVIEAKHSFTGLIRSAGDFNDAGPSALESALDAEAAAADEDLAEGLSATWEEAELASDSDDSDLSDASGAAFEDSADAELHGPHAELLGLAALRGAGFGTALHGLLETRDLGKPLCAQLDHVRHWLAGAGLPRRDFEALASATARAGGRELAAAGFDAAAQRIARRLDAALAAPLGLPQAPTRSLGAVPGADQRAEMGFEFALPEIRLEALAAACRAHGEPDLVPAGRRRLAGLLTGKIDLVLRVEGRFHVLDYKGNWLGERLSDYADAELRRHMDASHYRFQALLYTLALDRYLAQRLGAAYSRTEHLGECVYLFLRAAGLAPGAGVWCARFTDALIDDAQAALAGEREFHP